MTDLTVTQMRSEAASLRPSRARVLYLDGWRGLSIALVLIGHFLPVPGINLGLLGVEFFFVLSGRLMAEILFIENYPLKPFFKRRFARIYPALVVFVLAGMVIFAGTFVAYKWKAALTALTFTYNYVGILINRAGALDHIWSLCVEEHAYIMLALVSVLVSRGRLAAVLAVFTVAAMASGAVSWWVFGLDFEASYWRTDTHVASILVSALICWLKTSPRWKVLMQGRYLAPVAALCGVVFFLDAVPMPLHYIVGTLFLAIAVNTLDFAPRGLTGVLSLRPAVQLGLWSYSLYLWQQPFYKFVYFQGSPVLPMLALTFLCALSSFYLIEQPARRWLNRNW
ncbi:acyltransferase [Mesorhizobium sp. SP-1A]|uniref:acyltransferase family protein n=1 Tax=Mesorhizobium sp. SP-1A TaxID=3077840 RepID=UPI0028F6CCA4|nr:acyltransferase [Mesorhizobium sp. SP-1A]